jgi:ParB/RepB/Spo0J family partition protein
MSSTMDRVLKGTGAAFLATAKPSAAHEVVRVVKVPVGDIDEDADNARKHFDADELTALADGIKRHGQLQPAVGYTDHATGRVQLVAGHRRLRACKLAEIPTLTVMLLPRETAEETKAEIGFAENVARSDLTPRETATHWARLMERWGISGSELARRLGVSQSCVSKKLKLLKDDATATPAAGKIKTSTTQGEKRKITFTEFNTPNGIGRLKRGGTLRGLIAELEELARSQEPAAAA